MRDPFLLKGVIVLALVVVTVLDRWALLRPSGSLFFNWQLATGNWQLTTNPGTDTQIKSQFVGIHSKHEN
jgi:hypothetical protein